MLKNIPIHHVYGTLGQFPLPAQHPQSWIQASKTIRTIFDAEKDESVLSAAESLLKAAHTICLLGFGFHRENIELLDLVGHTQACKGVVAASRYDIFEIEWKRVTSPFTGIDIHNANYSYKCLNALRNLPIF